MTSDPTAADRLDEARRAGPDRSRRAVLAWAGRLGALGAAGLAAACSTLGLPKRSKAEAAYQDHPNRGQACAGCVHFEAPNRCTVVEGVIAPHGWSRYYLAKPAA